MVYECENCETALGPGLLACPNCGEVFDEPVPPDATLPDHVDTAFAGSFPAALTDPEVQSEEEWVSPPPPSVPDAPAIKQPIQVIIRRRVPGLPLLAAAMLGIILLVSLVWLGLRLFSPPTPLPTIVSTLPAPFTEMNEHPAYAGDMKTFVAKLHASGVDAQWPAFGSTDTLLVTTPTVVRGQQAAWNTNLYKQLAQGIYAGFWEKRYETGFSDSDSTTCFVLVSDGSGKIVAVDLMGTVQ